MRPVFCGNFEFDTRQSDLERLFSKYGRVDRVDMKSGTFYYLGFSLSCYSSFVSYVLLGLYSLCSSNL